MVVDTGMPSEVFDTSMASGREEASVSVILYKYLLVSNTPIYNECVKAIAHGIIPTISLLFVYQYFCLATITGSHRRDPIAHRAQTFTINILTHYISGLNYLLMSRMLLIYFQSDRLIVAEIFRG